MTLSWKRPALFLLCLVVAVGLVATTGCNRKSTEERMVEKMLEKGTGGAAKVDLKDGTIKIKTAEGEAELGSLSKWPADLPGELPRFEGGKFANAAKMGGPDGTGWIMSIQEVEEAAVTSYIQGLKDAGWKELMSNSMPESIQFMGEKDNVTVTLTYIKSDKGLSYTVSAKPGK
jgi:hypothetical protein